MHAAYPVKVRRAVTLLAPVHHRRGSSCIFSVRLLRRAAGGALRPVGFDVSGHSTQRRQESLSAPAHDG